MHWRIEIAGVTITVTAESPAARSLVEATLTEIESVRTETAEGTHLTVSGQADNWRITDHSTGKSRRPPAAGDVIYNLTDRMVHHIAAGSSSHHGLHAAAASAGGRCVLLPADSGSGKSLLAAWLCANGFDYITDELTLVDRNQRVNGLTRPIQVKPGGLKALSGLTGDRPGVIRGLRSNAVPVSTLSGRASRDSNDEVGLILFPRFKSGAGFKVSPVTAAEAGMKMVSSHINARNFEGHGFRSLMALVKTTPCYLLEYGGFNEFPEDFTQQLKALMKRV